MAADRRGNLSSTYLAAGEGIRRGLSARTDRGADLERIESEYGTDVASFSAIFFGLSEAPPSSAL